MPKITKSDDADPQVQTFINGKWQPQTMDGPKLKTLLISKEGRNFVVDSPDRPGSPPVGRGDTMEIALGEYLRNNQDWLGITIVVDPSAEAAEQYRRRAAERQR